MSTGRFWQLGSPLAPLAQHLAGGGVIAFPTESSYALGADPRNREGVEAIYRLKERERGKALPVVVADREQLAGLGAHLRGPALAAAAACWPAALSLVLPVTDNLPAAAGGGTIAVRVLARADVRALLAALGHGLTATSANRSGDPPLLDPVAVAAWLAPAGGWTIDGGLLPGGLPSTLVEPTLDGQRLTVLRSGRFDLEPFAAWLAETGQSGRS